MTNTERFLSILASIISIGQFVIAVPSLLGLLNPPIVTHVAALAVPARVAILIILEVSCAHVFGFLFSLAAKAAHEAVAFLAVITIAVVNAWISIFNIQYFLFRASPIQSQHLWAVLPVVALAAVIACWFAAIHIDNSYSDPAEAVPVIQVVAYLFLYIALWFQ
ncbi:MAG TPA: hypothetical protein VGG20_18485 [Thermoanaerobaculia bacterium]|jgi:hypothetical protein